MFGLLARSVLGKRLLRPLAHLLFFALLATFLGASGIVHDAVPGTRFELVVRVAVIVVAGRRRRGRPVAALRPVAVRGGRCAIALLAAPTLAGHALDRDQTNWLAVPVDLAHVTAAAIWLGGLVSLVFVVPARPWVRASVRGSCGASRRPRSSPSAYWHCRARACPDRAAQRLADVVDLLRPCADRQDSDLRAAPRPGLAQSQAPAGRVRAASSLGDAGVRAARAIVIAVAVLTELRPGRLAEHAARQPRRRSRRPTAGAAAARRGRRRTRARRRLGVGDRADAGPRHGDAARPGRHGGGGRAHVAIDGRAAVELRQRLLPGAGRLAGPCARRRSRSDVRPPGDGARRHGPAARRDPGVPRRAHGRLRRASVSLRPAGSIQHASPLVAPNRLAYQTRGGASAIVIGARRWDRSAREAVRRVAPDATRRAPALLDDRVERPRDRAGRTHVPGPKPSRRGSGCRSTAGCRASST